MYCALFGFSGVELGKGTISKLQNAYCLVITVVHFVLCAISLICKLCYMEVSYVSVLRLAATITIITHYRIKFVVAKDIMTNIINNLNYVDKLFSSIGVAVPRTRDHIVCLLYQVVVVIHKAVYTYVFDKSVTSSDMDENIVYEYAWVLDFIVKMSLFYSTMTLEYYIVLTIIRIQQRVIYLRHAVNIFTEVTNKAWTSSGSGTFIRVYGRAIRRIPEQLFLIHSWLYDEYFTYKEIYNFFFRFIVLLVVFSASLFFVNAMSYAKSLHLFLFITHELGNHVSPLWLISSIRSDFRLIDRFILNNTFDDIAVKRVESWIFQSRLRSMTYDCAYFDIDFSLFLQYLISFRCLCCLYCNRVHLSLKICIQGI